MAYTVAYSFTLFFENINLDGDHRGTANARRDRVVSLLEKKFDVVEAFASGSIPRFTAVSGHADVDVIVALHYSKHIKDKTPVQVLQAVRDALGDLATIVRKNGQAVTLYYQTWPNVDIVSASRSVDQEGQITHYNIPDVNTGKWLQTRPKSHSANIEQRASTCGASFRQIIKMIKWWNHQHSAYLQSYHIEVMALRAFTGPLNDMSWDVYSYFNSAAELAATYLWHDSGFADDYLGYNDRAEAVKRLETARDLARDAWYATYGKNDDHETAIRKWRQIFGDTFPKYG